MNKPLISLGLLVAALQACSGKPAGFQGDTASLSGSVATGDATGRSVGNRDAESDDATAASGNPADGIEAQIIETENVEMDAATIMEGSDATISVPGDASGSGSDASGSNASGSTSSGSIASGSTSSGSTSSGSTASGSTSSGSTTSGSTASGSGSTSSGSTASGSGSTGSTAAAVAPLTLTITVPSTSLRSGSTGMQATAKITGQTSAADVTWTAKASSSNNAGSIDSTGLYTAPATGGGYDVTLTATLNDDPSITASVTIKIVAPEQIFVGCQQGSEFFPITADVYQLAANTTKLPNFSTIGAKLTTVCMDQYNVAARDWSAGFPGVTGLFEWFALRTSTHVTAATDGTYTFKLNADDGAKLYIDGQLVIDNDGQHAPTAKEGSMYLTAGDHALTIDYFQGPRYQIALELYWKIPGVTSYTYVPKTSFK